MEAKIKHPKELSQELHTKVLTELCGFLREAQTDNSELATLRVRDWDFVVEFNVPTAQIFLSNTEPNGDVQQSVPLHKFASFHRWLLEHDAFSDFDDSITLEVGSEGIEPPLRFIEDFVGSINKLIFVQTRNKLNAKNKFQGVLTKVENNPDIDCVISIDCNGIMQNISIKEILRAKLVYCESNTTAQKKSKAATFKT